MNSYLYCIIFSLLHSMMVSCNVTHQLAKMIDPFIGGIITTSGSYYIDWNVTGTIRIAISDVALNLNEHTVNGPIIIESSLQNISISHGIINPLNNGDNGIVINPGCDVVLVDDIIITQARVGMNIGATGGLPVTNLLISNVHIKYCTLQGYYIQECTGRIYNSSVYANGAEGMLILPTSSLTRLEIERFSVIQNTFHGLSLAGGQYYCKDILAVANGLGGALIFADLEATFVHCTFESNNGFGFQGGGNVSLFDCIALNNDAYGFVLQDGGLSVRNSALVDSCIAQSNGAGGALQGDGFFIRLESSLFQVLVNNCISISNAGGGFNYLLFQNLGAQVLQGRFFGNFAFGNATSDYIYNGQNLATNQPPFYWQSWVNQFTSTWFNVSGKVGA